MNKVLGSTFSAPLDQSPVPLIGLRNPQMGGGSNQFHGPRMDMFGGGSRPPFFKNRNNFDNSHRPPRFQGPRGGPSQRMRFQNPPQDNGDEALPGCTVYLKNIPYKATSNDILEFFEGFNHQGNVLRRFNSNNTPTDEAKITFYDVDEASRAVDELQKMKIWDRSIFLRQE